MTKKQFLAYHKTQCKRMNDILVKKNSDYTGGSMDPFFNFKQVEMIGLTTAEIGIMTRVMDKISRVSALLKGNKRKVKDEGLEDTLLDCANYLIILAGMINENKKRKVKKSKI